MDAEFIPAIAPDSDAIVYGIDLSGHAVLQRIQPSGSVKLSETISGVGGNRCIAYAINHRIRRVDASMGIIYTIAGNGVSGFSGDGGPTLAAETRFRLASQ